MHDLAFIVSSILAFVSTAHVARNDAPVAMCRTHFGVINLYSTLLLVVTLTMKLIVAAAHGL
ncbi:hypothetical protein BCR37DRAFT_383925 [Protomyces lactucae-debilis]|uniref:Uncharacterized protein n=1 Tax=Protomyces lactucae-debilis TaxID=2754530 RepID=A0A1Y2EWB0_PROLT|nr:uncharacterized protein BCR37DRAFT_383925 [Protomyces lactucae-debilis]ORY75787.1 hypothetical protein BCR37DRAFT_383925 [Protomyces lactucae-debilis]